MSSRACIWLIALLVWSVGCQGKADLAAVEAQRGRWESAAKLYREYLEEHPGDFYALLSLAAIECYRLDDYEPCAEHVDRALATMPIDTQGVATGIYAYTVLADRAAQRGDTAGARAHIDRVADIYYQAAYWNYISEKYRIAEEQFRHVVRLKPGDPLAYIRLGILFWNEHREDSSVAWFERAAALKPISKLTEDALVNLLVVHQGKNDHEKATEAYNRLGYVRRTLYPDSTFDTEIDTTKQPVLDMRGEGPWKWEPFAPE